MAANPFLSSVFACLALALQALGNKDDLSVPFFTAFRIFDPRRQVCFDDYPVGDKIAGLALPKAKACG
jgi:hypothetical protein